MEISATISCVAEDSFLQAIMDKSAEGGQKSRGNTLAVWKNPPVQREQWQNLPRNLKLLYATGPWSLSSVTF